MFRFFVSPCQFLTRLHFLTTVFFSQQPKQKRRVLRGELDLAVLPSFAQSKRKKTRIDFVVMVFVCVPSVCLCEYVCWLVVVLSWGRGVRLSIVFAPAGAWIVCVFLSQARSLFRFSHTVSLSLTL